MVDPPLTLFNGHSVATAANNDWSGDPELSAAGTRVRAFAIGNPASKDTMLLATLSPGSYTTQVSGAHGAGGDVILEVYEVP